MLSISVTNKKLNIELKLSHKISYILGNSATGKTRLINALLDESGAYKIITNRDVIFIRLTKNNWELLLSNWHSETIVYLVDDGDFIKTLKFGQVINKVRNAYFLFVIRSSEILADCMKQNVYSVHADAIYEMKEIYDKHYECLQSNNPREFVPELDYSIVVEDESSGLVFFNKLAGDKVLTGKGKDNILPWLREEYELLNLKKSILLIVDYAAIGFKLNAIINYLESMGHVVYIIKKYESFEYMLLCSNLFKDFKLDFSEYLQYVSHEDMYTYLLEQLTKGKPYSYKKGDLKRCYTENCCTVSRKDLPCDKGLSGDKMQGLLEGTIFEEILSLRKGMN